MFGGYGCTRCVWGVAMVRDVGGEEAHMMMDYYKYMCSG